MSALLAGLDCTGDSFSVALVRGEECLAEAGGWSPRAHLRLLFPALEECAARAGVRLRDLEGVAVTAGPGSFTGLRLGIVTARTLAWTLGCPAVAVDTLEALALNIPEAPRVVAGLDARRGEIFAASFRTVGGEAEGLDGVRAWAPRDLAQAMADAGGGVLVGSAAARYAEIFREVPGVSLAPPLYGQVRGSVVARLGLRILARGGAVAPLELAPTYLRSAEVQVHGGPS